MSFVSVTIVGSDETLRFREHWKRSLITIVILESRETRQAKSREPRVYAVVLLDFIFLATEYVNESKA